MHYEDVVVDSQLTPGILRRVFGHFARHLQSTEPGTLTYRDFVCFFLAEKDRMSDTSLQVPPVCGLWCVFADVCSYVCPCFHCTVCARGRLPAWLHVRATLPQEKPCMLVV